MRVGHFKSIPWIPPYAAHDAWPVTFVDCVSSTVIDLLRQVDVTPMATVDWFPRQQDWCRLENHGLWIRERAGSVLLFSPWPIEQLGGKEIAISDETSTSVRVLHALLTGKYGLSLGTWRRGVVENDQHTPRLLIQNQAVHEIARRRFEYVYDLGHEWRKWQGVPLVPAVWVYRRGLSSDKTRFIADLLDSSLGEFSERTGVHIESHRHRNGWTASTQTVERLLRNFEYRMNVEAERGLEAMRSELPVVLPQLIK